MVECFEVRNCDTGQAVKISGSVHPLSLVRRIERLETSLDRAEAAIAALNRICDQEP